MDLCEQCKQNKATVHIEKTINNIKQEYNLCTKCAEMIDTEISFDNFLKSFLESILSLQIDDQTQQAYKTEEITCRNCGLTYSKFKQNSRFGCANCYDVFRQKIDVTLKNIQGSNKHIGKLPNRGCSDLIFIKRINTLKAELAKAIELEEYEQAAIIRDKIKAIEK